MFKIVFVLLLNSINGGFNADLQFATAAQCEAAKQQIQSASWYKIRGSNFGATCIEMQVPLKKLKCDIVNQKDYQNSKDGWPNAHNMDGYPYPTAIECKEE